MIPEARSQLLLLCATMGLAMTAYFMVVTLVPLYGLALGLTPAAIGLLVSLGFLAPLFAAVPIGGVLDRSGGRAFVIAGCLVMSVLTLLTSLVPSALAVAGMQLGLGLAQILLMLSGQALVASIGPLEQRLRNFGLYTMAVSAGQLFGPLAAGFMADAVGYATSLAIAGAVAAGAALGAVLLPKAPGARVPPRGVRVQRRLQVTRLWQRDGIRTAMIASSTVLIAVAVNQVLLPVVMVPRGASASTVGILFSVMALSGMLVRPFIGAVVRLLGAHRVALVSVSLLVAAGMLVLGLQQQMYQVVIAVVMLGIGSGISQPLSMTMVLDEVDENERGVALGFRISVNRLAQIIGPLAVGVVATYLGAPFALVMTSAVLVAILLVLGRRSGRPAH